ncbi:hypothetical protein AAER91_35335, partial [Klebsiella pneumoniae]
MKSVFSDLPLYLTLFSWAYSRPKPPLYLPHPYKKAKPPTKPLDPQTPSTFTDTADRATF